MSERARLSVSEVFGLSPISVRAREAWFAVRGDASVPGTRVGLSSLGILHPALSLRTWLGNGEISSATSSSISCNPATAKALAISRSVVEERTAMPSAPHSITAYSSFFSIRRCTIASCSVNSSSRTSPSR